MKSFIRHCLLLMAVLILIPGMARSEKIQRVEFRWSLDDFNISYHDSLVRVSSPLMASYNYPGEPSMPSLCYYVPVPEGMRCVGFRYEIPETVTVCENKVISRNPNLLLMTRAEILAKYPGGIVDGWEPCDDLITVYPEPTNKIIYHINGFLIYPFEYNPNTRTMTFTPKVIADMILEPLEDTRPSKPLIPQETNVDGRDDEIIKMIIFEGNDERVYTPQTYKLTPDYDIIEDPIIEEPVDYVIIAHGGLEDSFSDLLKWKTQKGLRCRLKTIQDIEEEYSDYGSTTQERIKSYIHDMYLNHGASYVLLDGYVPPAMAKMEFTINKDTISEMIPTDLYYACFDGQFDWDGDRDGILGEEEDGISITPNILVTRVPVHSPSQARNYVYKLIGYEKDPKVNKKILMEGGFMGHTMLSVRPDGNIKFICDGQYQSEMLYNSYIAPKWDGELQGVYANPTGEHQETSLGTTLGDALRYGHGFIDVECHGAPDKWVFREKEYFGDTEDAFYSADAKGIVNPAYTVVTTTACHVNSFDNHLSHEQPCLSQALISQPRNGVVAFLGSTREGWGYGNLDLGPSQTYIGAFYSLLFDAGKDGIADNESKNFGKIVAAIKNKMGSRTTNPLFRWLQFSINPIGDPEMPLFYGPKKLFEDIKVTEKSGTLSVDTGVEGCVICLTGEMDGEPYQKVFRDTKTATFTVIPEDAVLCVTKQNYKPYIHELANPNGRAMALSAYGEISSVSINPSELAVELCIDDFASESCLVLAEAMSSKQTMIEVTPEEGTVSIDTAGMPGGIYILNLYVDGWLKDSKRFMLP